MRVTMVTNNMYVMGGTETHIRDLSLGLLADGHDVSVITGSTGFISDELAEAGITIREFEPISASPLRRPFKYAKATAQLTSVLKELSPNIVHSHGWGVGSAVKTSSRMLGLPSVHTIHGWSVTKGRQTLKQTARKALHRLGEFVTNGQTIFVSDADRNFGIEENYSNAHNSRTIHNGIPDVPADLRKSFSAINTTTPVKLIMVARLDKKQKDHTTTLKALAGLKHLNWTIDFAGVGDTSEYKALARDLGIADRCNFLGEIVNVEQRLADKDIFILTSRFEGLPIAIIEAMRAGLPVIANDVGGNTELVRDGQNGYIRPYGDIEGVRNAIQSLITDPGKRLRFGQKGRERYENQFTLRQMTNKMTDIYRSTVTQHQTHIPRPAFLRLPAQQFKQNIS